jgi:hypothetical protein
MTAFKFHCIPEIMLYTLPTAEEHSFNMLISIFWVAIPVNLYADTNIWEECSASIFRAETLISTCKLRWHYEKTNIDIFAAIRMLNLM